jgi:hypothetical protein
MFWGHYPLSVVEIIFISVSVFGPTTVLKVSGPSNEVRFSSCCSASVESQTSWTESTLRLFAFPTGVFAGENLSC